jgi:uncharacterized membrane protein
MEISNATNELLQRINDDNGGTLTFNEEAIQQDLAADAAAYTGIGIKVLSVLGGLLGSLFFLGFVFMAVKDAETIMAVFGLLTIIAAIWVEKTQRNTVLDAACVGAYLAGFAMLGIGVDKLFDSDNITTLILLATAIFTVFFNPGFMVGFFSVVIINTCFFAFININDAYQLMHLLTAVIAGAYVFVNMYEAPMLASSAAVNKQYKALCDGLLVSLLIVLIYLSARKSWEQYFTNEWVSSVIIIALITVVLNRVTAFVNTVIRTRIMVYILGLLILAPLIFAPAICGAILILLISFHTGHYRAQAIGIIALVYFVGQYYYDLNFTLLAKSGMMFGTGLLFLIAWFILKKQLKRYEEA